MFPLAQGNFLQFFWPFPHGSKIAADAPASISTFQKGGRMDRRFPLIPVDQEKHMITHGYQGVWDMS